MAKWRQAHITNAHFVPAASYLEANNSQVVITVGPVTKMTPDTTDSKTYVTAYGGLGKITCRTCNVISDSIASAFVLEPADTAYFNLKEGVARSWARDMANLGRDLSVALKWSHERHKQG